MSDDGASFPETGSRKAVDVTSWRVAPFMRRLCANLDSLGIAISHFLNLAPPTDIPDGVSFCSGRLNLGVGLPAYQILRCLVLKQPERSIAIRLTSKSEVPGFNPARDLVHTNMFHYIDLFDNAAHTQFTAFFETYTGAIRIHAKHDKNSSVPPWGFARLVRNAITHGARINLRDQMAPEIVWRGISIGPKDDGTPLSEKLQCADIIILMLDMDRALQRILGPPV